MLILDTDHFSELLRGGQAGRRLEDRLAAATDRVGTTVVTFEEQARGWLAKLKRTKDPEAMVGCYSEF